MNNYFKIIILIILTLLCLSVSAQKQDIKFKHLSLEDGLSQSTINTIFQDSKGFLWIGTQDGLNKYDGYEFTVYKHAPDNLNSLSNNYKTYSIAQTMDCFFLSGFQIKRYIYDCK